MKLLVALVGLFLFSRLDNAPKHSNSIKNQICKTWVAYKVVTAEPMLKRKSVIKIDKANTYSYDSLQINKDGTYHHYCYQTSFNGNWTISADSTRLFILPKSPTHANSGWIITALSDSSLHLKQFAGREGESRTWQYKPVEGAKN